MGPREQEGTTLFDQAEVKRKETDKTLAKHNQQEPKLPPLVNDITTSVKKKSAPFHFPGHKRGMAALYSLVDVIGNGPFLHDATELPKLDRFDYPTGPLLDAQKMDVDPLVHHRHDF
ncbi:hypothetical protein MTR67_052219 [Solanum verrucosum]|uniref:Uncharacterized protein n=1 Tax=Solanum verrucosum TaxID=315347 RepID=A0AAF1A3C5_SOLVR|nr:hypothetical protein MTR67_052219 [Solanum verrucosum]